MDLALNIVFVASVSIPNWKAVPQTGVEAVRNSIVSMQQAEPSILFQQSKLLFCQESYISSDVVSFEYIFENQSDDSNVSLSLGLVGNKNTPSENEFFAIQANSGQSNIILGAEGAQLKWQGDLPSAKLKAIPFINSFFDYIPLETTFNIGSQACRLNCVNNIWHWEFPFTYQGVAINDFYVDAKGAIYFESPSESIEKAIVAPLINFTDTEYRSEVRFAELLSTLDGTVYQVIEWTHYSNFEKLAKYQLIIEENSSNIWFNYLDKQYIVDYSNDVFIGARNQSGLAQYNLVQTSGYDLLLDNNDGENITFKLMNQAGATLELKGKIKLSDLVAVNTEVQINILEDHTSILALADLETQYNLSLDISHSQQDITYLERASVPVYLQSSLTLTVLDPPDFGVLNKEKKELTYQPNSDFYGEDSIHYQLSDDFVRVTPSILNFKIDPVNDAPKILIAQSQLFAFTRERVNLNATVIDIDSDKIELTWVQISGPNIAIKHDELGYYFIAPLYLPNGTELISLKAIAYDDYNAASTSIITIKVQNNPLSSGTLGLLLILFINLIIYRRKK